MDSEHTCILRHEGDAMMFSKCCALHGWKGTKGKAFQALLQPLGIQNVGAAPPCFGTVMVLGPYVGGTVSLAWQLASSLL